MSRKFRRLKKVLLSNPFWFAVGLVYSQWRPLVEGLFAFFSQPRDRLLHALAWIGGLSVALLAAIRRRAWWPHVRARLRKPRQHVLPAEPVKNNHVIGSVTITPPSGALVFNAPSEMPPGTASAMAMQDFPGRGILVMPKPTDTTSTPAERIERGTIPMPLPLWDYAQRGRAHLVPPPTPATNFMQPRR